MSENIDYSISETAIDNTIMKIIDLSEEINGIFNKMDDLMEKTNSIYECESATILKSKYQTFRENYPVVISNLLSYSTDMVSLKKKFKANIDILAENLSKARTKLEKVAEYKEER